MYTGGGVLWVATCWLFLTNVGIRTHAATDRTSMETELEAEYEPESTTTMLLLETETIIDSRYFTTYSPIDETSTDSTEVTTMDDWALLTSKKYIDVPYEDRTVRLVGEGDDFIPVMMPSEPNVAVLQLNGNYLEGTGQSLVEIEDDIDETLTTGSVEDEGLDHGVQIYDTSTIPDEYTTTEIYTTYTTDKEYPLREKVKKILHVNNEQLMGIFQEFKKGLEKLKTESKDKKPLLMQEPFVKLKKELDLSKKRAQEKFYVPAAHVEAQTGGFLVTSTPSPVVAGAYDKLVTTTDAVLLNESTEKTLAAILEELERQTTQYENSGGSFLVDDIVAFEGQGNEEGLLEEGNEDTFKERVDIGTTTVKNHPTLTLKKYLQKHGLPSNTDNQKKTGDFERTNPKVIKYLGVAAANDDNSSTVVGDGRGFGNGGQQIEDNDYEPSRGTTSKPTSDLWGRVTRIFTSTTHRNKEADYEDDLNESTQSPVATTEAHDGTRLDASEDILQELGSNKVEQVVEEEDVFVNHEPVKLRDGPGADDEDVEIFTEIVTEFYVEYVETKQENNGSDYDNETSTAPSVPMPNNAEKRKHLPKDGQNRGFEYEVWEDGIVCIAADMKIIIEYRDDNNDTRFETVPKTATVTGSCNKTFPFMILSWPTREPAKAVTNTLTIILSSKNNRYYASDLEIDMLMENGVVLSTNAQSPSAFFNASMRNMYKCELVNVVMDDDAKVMFTNVKFRAFNELNEVVHDKVEDCNDAFREQIMNKSAQIMGIAVGVCAALLVAAGALCFGYSKWKNSRVGKSGLA